MQHGLDSDKNGIVIETHFHHFFSCTKTCDPSGMPVSRRDFSVQRHGCLHRDERTSMNDPVIETRVELGRAFGTQPFGDTNALRSEKLEASSGMEWIRIASGDMDRFDLMLHDGLGAGRRAAERGAGFQCDEELTVFRRMMFILRVTNGIDFCMCLTGTPMPSFADDDPFLDQNGSNRRVGRYQSLSPPSQGEGTEHKGFLCFR